MFRRGLAILLCSAMLAGSLPETGFAAEIETAETETVEAETAEVETTDAEVEDDASTESSEDAQTSQTAAPETQTVSGTEETETTETEAVETSETEGNTEASEETSETVTQDEEKTEIVTEAVTETTTEEVVSETATETEETTIVETEEETTEVTTEEETTEVETEEITTEEIENADSQDGETLGNSDIKLSNVKVAYNSISFDYAEKNSDVRYVYIIDPKGDKYVNNEYLSGTSGSITFDGLNPSTEYKVSFKGSDEDNITYYEFTKTTAECPYNVEYTANSTAADNLSITAKITAKEGADYTLPQEFYLNYKVFNAEGECVAKDNFISITVSSLPVEKTAVVPYDPLYIFGDTEYTFETWISEYGYGETQFAKKSDTKGKTAASVVSEVEFTPTPDESDASKINYTLTTGGYTNSVDVYLSYRLKGSNESWYENERGFSTSNGSYTGSISDLSLGATYEYLINAAGFKKTGEFKSKEGQLQWNMSCDAGALDTVVTFALDKNTFAEGASDEDYRVEAQYKRHQADYWEDDLYQPDDDDKTKYVAYGLYPNTEYDIKFDITEKLPNGKTNKYTALETVTTKAAAFKLSELYQYVDAVTFDIAFDSSVVRTDYFDGLPDLYPYVKNEDGKYKRLEGWVEIGVENNGAGAIYNLESNKAYEVSLGWISDEDDSFVEFGTISVRTAADDRSFTIDAPAAGVSSVTVTGTLKGKASSYEGSGLIMYWKESGSDKYKNYKYATIYAADKEDSDERDFEIYASGLEAGKSYDYVIGLGDSSLGVDKLKGAKKGTIKLNLDERSVEVTETVPLLNNAVAVKAKLSGRYIDAYNSAYMFYREKGNADAVWKGSSYENLSFSSGSRETTTWITGLKSGTTYEYKLSMKYPQKEEDYAVLSGGEFTYTQPMDDRALTAAVTEKRTSAEFAVTLTGSSRASYNYITIFVREKGSTSWERKNYTDIKWDDNQTTVNMTVSSLIGETEYEYLVGISNGYIYSDTGILEGKKTEGTFTTKDDRKLGEPAATASYTTVEVQVDVDGLTREDNGDTYVALYTKDPSKSDAAWVRKTLVSVADVSSDGVSKTVKLAGSNLESGKTYSYALVMGSYSDIVSPDSEKAFDKLSANKKFVGTFITKASPYTLEITENEKSVYNKEVLNLKANAAGFDEKNFSVNLTVSRNVNGTETYTSFGSYSRALNSVDQTEELEITGLTENTKYKVEANLFAVVVASNGNSVVTEKVATTEFSFTTKAAAAPTELKADVEEVKLNSWNVDYQSYSAKRVNITVPDGASNEVIWTSTDETVAYAYTYNGYNYILAEKPGEVTITAASKLAPSVKADIKVTVKNYGVVFTDTKTASLYNSVYTRKGTESTNVKYAAITDDGKQYQEVEAVGTSRNPNIAYWDKDKQCVVAKNVGSTYIILDYDGFKTDLDVAVYADSPDFDVTLSPTEDNIYAAYPALSQGENAYQIATAGSYGLSIAANPKAIGYNINNVIKITSSDEKVLKVTNGYVTGLKKGTATVTIAYDLDRIKTLAENNPGSAYEDLSKHTDLASKTKTITFDVRELPKALDGVNAITNVQKTLADVTIGEGWTWRDPETPLYSLPVIDSEDAYYYFEAKYTGNDYYNYEGSVKVNISAITGVDVANVNGSNVISAGGTDSMSLVVTPHIYGYHGLVAGTDYTVEIPAVANVTITEDENGYKVTAGKKGKYTLKPEIKVGGTTVATGSYAITAVDGALVDRIELVTETDNKNVTITGNTIYVNTDADPKLENFKLKAAAYDREGKEVTKETTKLTWTVTDKAVAALDTKADDRYVTVAIKGDGHAVIQVTAGDEAKKSVSYRLEVRNYKPRVEGDKITINTAYDYTTSAGRSLSGSQYGRVSVAPAYGDSITKVQVVDAGTQDGAANVSALADFEVYNLNNNANNATSVSTSNIGYFVVKPVNADMGTGKKDVKLAVTTKSGFVYTYPLAITVVNKQPKVSAKISNTMNMFYLSDRGHLDVTLEKNKSKSTDFTIEDFKWSNSAGEGFKFAMKTNDECYSSGRLRKTPNVYRYNINGSKVKVTNGKVDSSVASGTVTIKLSGVRKSYELPVTVKYSYKKPKLTTADWKTGKNTSMIIPSLSNGKSGSFNIRADKKWLYLTSNTSLSNDNYWVYYNECRCTNEEVTITRSSDDFDFRYNGTEDQFDIPLTIDSYNWREALTVTHKVKAVKPTAVLSNAKLIYNTNYDGIVYTGVSLKDYTYNIISAVDVAAADQTSYDLLTSGALQVEPRYYNNSSYVGAIAVKLDASKLSSVPKGASYVLTPYCYDSATGEQTALNTLALKITFTNKPVTAKISGKGKLDLAISNDEDLVSYDSYAEYYKDMTANGIAVTPKFANLGSGYWVEDAKLTGEYSQYFELIQDRYYNNKHFIWISAEGRGKLKAGQNYNLSMIYTLVDDDGNRITVKSSNVLKVKPAQKAPKITVVGDNQILYAASGLTRTCTIQTPYVTTGQMKDYYVIESAYGAIDTNKDGKADITVRKNSTTLTTSASLTIRLTDRDAIVAAEKGKTYTVPVTVKLRGRDGISKDAVVSIKVTVKR